MYRLTRICMLVAVGALLLGACRDLPVAIEAPIAAEPQANLVAPEPGYLQVSAGQQHTCAVTTDRSVVCWGGNASGQATPPAGTFTQVSAGESHTCAIRTDAALACWGYDGNGEGRTGPPGGTFIQVSVGTTDACALMTGGPLRCWGRSPNPPMPIYAQVSIGDRHTCAIRPDATLACWGINAFGEVNPPAGTFTQVSVGQFHSCAIDSDGLIACWGHPDARTSPPPGTFTLIDAGVFSTCAIKTDGTLECWGSNAVGRGAPPPGTFTGISVGAFHACAVATDQTIACWGSNDYGQTDVPDLTPDVTPPAISPTVAGTLGANGWYTTDVSLTWSVTDDESAVTSTGCGATSVTDDTKGLTITCTATSEGGEASASLVIKRDASAPVITFTGATSYTVDQTIDLSCSAADPTSGPATQPCQGESASGPAYAAGIGSHTIDASATNGAGLTATQSQTYTVAVTAASLGTLVTRWAGNGGVANSLVKKLEHGKLNAFINEVEAQSGKKIPADKAAILIRLARAM